MIFPTNTNKRDDAQFLYNKTSNNYNILMNRFPVLSIPLSNDATDENARLLCNLFFNIQNYNIKRVWYSLFVLLSSSLYNYYTYWEKEFKMKSGLHPNNQRKYGPLFPCHWTRVTQSMVIFSLVIMNVKDR